MTKSSKLFRSLREKVFGKTSTKPDSEPVSSHGPLKVAAQQSGTGGAVDERKDPYFIQIGFDFGTSYSKCVCRDMITNKAWVYIPLMAQEEELPFLIPSALVAEDKKIFHVRNPGVHYPKNGLFHLKNALLSAANGYLDAPLLAPYRDAVCLKRPNQLPAFLVVCAVYFLGSTIGEIRSWLRERFPGFGTHPKDYMAINLAIPVENAQQPIINGLYRRILCVSWQLADQLSGHSYVHLAELHGLIKKTWRKQIPSVEDACFVYPEVSANVQGFVRSRVSSPGIYLFSDTGGGTVDQSVFIFVRRDHREHLTYLTGRVLPLGSSLIERRAAEKCGKIDCGSLEKWRERKERGENSSNLEEAKNWIAKELNRETKKTVGQTSKKLFVKKQLTDIRVIFGGGGTCEHPYKSSVIKTIGRLPFGKADGPDIVGMPVPSDLELMGHEAKWMRRLSVAYGLSFEKGDLAPFTYPKNVSDPTSDEIWQPQKKIAHAPTKEEC